MSSKKRRLRTVREWISRGGKQGVPWEVGDRLLKETDTRTLGFLRECQAWPVFHSLADPSVECMTINRPLRK